MIATNAKRLESQLFLLHRRKGQLKKALYYEAEQALARVMLREQTPLLAVEALQVTPRGTWRPLAKHIVDMLSRMQFIDQAAARVTYYHQVGTGHPEDEVRIEVVAVDPYGTSQSCADHPKVKLKGIPGEWDWQYCPAKGQEQYIDRHGNSGRLIAKKANKILAGGVP